MSHVTDYTLVYWPSAYFNIYTCWSYCCLALLREEDVTHTMYPNDTCSSRNENESVTQNQYQSNGLSKVNTVCDAVISALTAKGENKWESNLLNITWKSSDIWLWASSPCCTVCTHVQLFRTPLILLCRYMTSIVTSHIRKSPPELDIALHKIKHLKGLCDTNFIHDSAGLSFLTPPFETSLPSVGCLTLFQFALRFSLF